MAETFPVEQRGIGKPDYSREVSSSIQRAGYYLKYPQQLVVFGYVPTDEVAHPYAIPWVQPVLGAGLSHRLYDVSTGLISPYAVPAGYSLSLIERHWCTSEDVEMWLYLDGLLIACPGLTSAGQQVSLNPVYGYSTLVFDPTATSAHTIDLVVRNRGLGAVEGGITYACILEAVGTPPFPTTKNCQCPFCTHQQLVKVEAVKITCENCGELYFVQDLTQIKKL